MAARSIWKGSVGFGLVNVPCKLFGATDEQETRFNTLHRDCKARIKQVRSCTACGKEVSETLGNQVKGFEVGDGQYLIMEKADFEAVPVKTMQSVEVLAFSDASVLDPRQVAKSYFLAPDAKLGGAKAFSLLIRAMELSGRVGIVKLVYREREHLAVIRPYINVLLLQTLYYNNELRSASEVEVPLPEVSKKELDMGIMLIKTLEVADPNLAQYKDEYQEALGKIIQAKVAGQPIVAATAEAPKQEMDLVEALMASIKAKEAVQA